MELEFKIKREKLFERTLPEARWSCKRYAPSVPKPRRNWALKAPQEPAKL